MAKQLTDSFIKRAKPGRHTDLFGLSLLVRNEGSRQWIWRGTVKGAGQVVISLGDAAMYSPDEAREIALGFKKSARRGIDPRGTVQEATATPTLAACIGKVIEGKRSDWKDAPKTESRWLKIIAKAESIINRPVDAVGTGDVEAALLRLRSTHSSMIELQRYLASGFSWAIAHGHRQDNPAEAVKEFLPRAPQTKHQKAVPYSDVSEALATVKASGAMAVTKQCVEFLILTAARSSEVRGALWSEFDLQARVWEIPGSRMKAGRPHRIPLSDRAIEILRAAETSDNGMVFASRAGKALSHGTLGKLARDLHLPGTIHGFRSTFSDWAHDCTDSADDVIEYSLAHVTGSSTERSYKRTDLLSKRVELMSGWERFVTASNVVGIRQTG